MGEERMYRTNEEDEINLYALWLIIWKGRLLILVVTLVFLAAGGFYVYWAPEVYRVNNKLILLQVSGVRVSTPEVKSILNELSPNHMAESVDMNADALRQIKGIQVIEIKGSDTLVQLEIDTVDRGAGVAFMRELPDYIMSRPYIARRIAVQKDLCIKNRDELKKIIDDPHGSLGRSASSPSLVYASFIDLYSCKERYNQLTSDIDQLEHNRLVMLAGESIAPEQPEQPRIKTCLAISVIAGISMGLLLVFMMEWARSTRDQ